MKIIGINTSPREQSNSRMLLEAALEHASSKGAQTQLFDANKMNITACQADNYCKGHDGECAIDDQMQDIYTALQEADAVIFATPVYFYNVCGTAKNVIDRLYSNFMTGFADKYGKDKKFSIILTCGMPEEGAFRQVGETAAKAFEAIGFNIVDIAEFPDNNIPAGVSDKEDQLEKAVQIADNLLE